MNKKTVLKRPDGESTVIARDIDMFIPVIDKIAR